MIHSKHYSRKIKRSIQQVSAYLLMRDPRARVTREQVLACHYFADTSTMEPKNRANKA